MKISLLYLTLASMVLASFMLPMRFAHSQDRSAETFTLNLKNTDIISLIETVSVRTGRNFIVDPRVKATVNFVSSEPISADKLYELFLSILEVHGYAAVQAGKFTKIIPAPVGVHSALPFYGDPADVGDKLVTHIIQLENISALRVTETIRPLLSQSASVGLEGTRNTLVVTERAANIEKLIELITLMDGG